MVRFHVFCVTTATVSYWMIRQMIRPLYRPCQLFVDKSWQPSEIAPI
jgi:hypothetical protein